MNSYVLDPPPASSDEARRFFDARLACECDAWDLYHDRMRGLDHTVVDARTAAAFHDLHIPGALNLQSRAIDEAAVAPLRGRAVVVYAWGPGCNAATKVAARLAALGISVKEMIGGLEAWLKNGYDVAGALARDIDFEAYIAWHHRRDEPFMHAGKAE
jgi:rhodanese-related sulfurtransferase